MVFEEFVEVSFREDILLLVKIETDKEISGVSLGDTCDIGLQLSCSSGLLELHLRRTSYLILFLMQRCRDTNGVPFLLEDIRYSNLLILAFLLDHLLDPRLHLDVLIGRGRIDRVNRALTIAIIVADLGGLLDDGFILNSALWTEVISEHVVSKVLEEVLLKEHLVELSQGIAKQLNSSSRYYL